LKYVVGKTAVGKGMLHKLMTYYVMLGAWGGVVVKALRY
jgi:hypothetical protein